MTCDHKEKDIHQQSFQLFGKHVHISACSRCGKVIKVVDEAGTPWTMPRTRDEIRGRLEQTLAGMLERAAKALRGAPR